MSERGTGGIVVTAEYNPGEPMSYARVNQHGWTKRSIATAVPENAHCAFYDHRGCIFAVIYGLRGKAPLSIGKNRQKWPFLLFPG